MRIAKAYREICLQEGPPLLVYSQKIRKSLKEKTALPVYLGMLYGKPSIEEGIKALLKENVQEIILIAMYPQYARATYGAAIDKSQEVLKQISPDSELKVIPPFYNHPAYLQAMVTQAAPYLRWNFDHLLFSFQGVPALYIHSLLASGNDLALVEQTGRTRSINRGHRTLAELDALYADPGSVTAQVKDALQRAIACRKEQPAFAAHASQRVSPGTPGVFLMHRECEQQNIAVLASVLSESQSVGLSGLDLAPGDYLDLLTGETITVTDQITLDAYRVCWLVAAE